MNDISTNLALSSLSANRAETLAKKTADTPQKLLTVEEKREYAKAARGFEAMFVEMMRKQMKDAMLDDDQEKDGEISFGADALEGYADMQFSDYVAKSGKGIGIARELYKKLTGGEELDAISQSFARINPDISPNSDVISPKSNESNRDTNSYPILPNKLPPINSSPTALARVRGDSTNERMQRLAPIISESAEKYGVPPELVSAVVRAESAGRHDAVSPAGAKGLMQLMDGTAADLGVRDSFDPQQNIEGGAKYLRQMLDMFGGNAELALAAYNAGPGAVQKYGGIPPFAETKQYVNRVIKYARMEHL